MINLCIKNNLQRVSIAYLLITLSYAQFLFINILYQKDIFVFTYAVIFLLVLKTVLVKLVFHVSMVSTNDRSNKLSISLI